jgi:hypothetical protein
MKVGANFSTLRAKNDARDRARVGKTNTASIGLIDINIGFID